MLSANRRWSFDFKSTIHDCKNTMRPTIDINQSQRESPTCTTTFSTPTRRAISTTNLTGGTNTSSYGTSKASESNAPFFCVTLFNYMLITKGYTLIRILTRLEIDNPDVISKFREVLSFQKKLCKNMSILREEGVRARSRLRLNSRHVESVHA